VKVRIVQLLCPARHCIMAFAYLADKGEVDPAVAGWLRTAFDDLCEAGRLHPWCALCHSREFRTEDGPTKWSSMEEAAPHLREIEAAQAATRDYFRAGKN
jgi:hypothetical protein